MDELSGWFEVAESVTTRGFMLAAIVGFIRGWWVPGYLYRRAIKTGDRWHEIALRMTKLGERHVGLDEALDRMLDDDRGH